MELCKQSLLNVQLLTQPITKNFTAIQDQFRKINASIEMLKQQNEDYKKFKQMINSFISNNQFNNNIPSNFTNQSVIRINPDNQPSNINKMPYACQDEQSQTNSVINQIQQFKKNVTILQTKSQTVLQNQQNQAVSVLNDATNMPQMKKTTSSSIPQKDKDYRKSKQSRNLVDGKKQNQIYENISSKNSFSQNKTLLQQINQIRQRLQEIDSTQNTFREQIKILQKENEKFRKIFGVKKLNKQKTTTNLDKEVKSKKALNSFSKKSINSQLNLQLRSQESNLKQMEEDQVLQFDCFKQLKDDIQKIRDYLSGKMKAIDTNFAEVNIKMHNMQRSIDILQRTQNSLKQDIQFLQKTSNQTKLNITQLNEKSLQMSKSRYKKHQNQQSNQKTQQNQKQLDVQQRIMNLLDQMQQLKEQYQQIIFGKHQNIINQNDTPANQKRKKLALKLNNNVVIDQKLKKQLSNCKRDLKKLKQDFDYLMNGINTGTHQTKTLIIKPNQTKQQWKTLSTKINKFKQQLQSQIKDLQGKITTNNELAVVLNQFQVGIQQCKILLKKKIDIVDFDKTTKRIQGRLNNFIRQTFDKQGYTNQQDAVLAKQPWYCLSCDVQLKTYSGKQNKTNPMQTSSGDKFVGKKVNPQSHMVRRNENGRLPSIAI